MYRCEMCGRKSDQDKGYRLANNPGLARILSDGKFVVPDTWFICLKCKTLLEIQKAVMDLRPPQHHCGPF